MSQRTRVTGTRSAVIWLLIIVAVLVAVALVVGGLIVYPRLQDQRAKQARLGQAEQHYQAGTAFQNVGDWKSAEAEFKQVIALDANYKDVQSRLTEVRRKLEASRATATAIAQATASAAPTATAKALEAHYEKGLAHINLEEWTEARKELKTVFDVDPNYQDVQAQLAQVNAEIAKLTPTATPTPTITSTPKNTPTPTVTVTFVPSPTATPKPFPTATYTRTPLPTHAVASPTPTSPPSRLSYQASVDDNWDVYTWDLQAKRSTRVTRDAKYDGQAAWSPDRRQLVFESARSGNPQLYLYDLSKREIIEQLTQSLNDRKGWPMWSPDGRQILYSRWTEDANWQIWLLTLETRETQILTHSGMNKAPRWSPQGDRIAFSAARDDTNGDGIIDNNDERHLYVMNSDGTNIRSLAAEPGYYDWAPHWMPDGLNVVFSRHVKGDTQEDNGPGEIYIVNTVTEEVRALTFTSADEEAAIASPKGDQFLVVRNEDDTMKIYLASWNGMQLGELEFLVAGDYPAWAPTE